MSTHPQYTLKSQDVYKLTINTLDTLPLTMLGAIQSRDLQRVLVFAAASRLSVHHACDQLAGALSSQFSDLDALEGHVNDLLAKLIPKGLSKRGRRVAIDVVALPYHGTVEEAHQDEVCRSKAKGGTTHFFTYATAYAEHSELSHSLPYPLLSRSITRCSCYTLWKCQVRRGHAPQSASFVSRGGV